jgi:DNA-binding XRE family transcriptional regulator
MKVILSFSSMDFRRKQTRLLEEKFCERSVSKKSTTMKKKKPALKSFSDHLDELYGPLGTKTRDEYEQGFEAFKLGFMLQELRKGKGLTQQQLADRCGTTKNYISRIENDASDIRLSTLMRIVADGLGATLRLSVG